MHTKHSECSLIGNRNSSGRHHGVYCRDIGFSHKALNLLGSLRCNNSSAQIKHRFFGSVYMPCKRNDFFVKILRYSFFELQIGSRSVIYRRTGNIFGYIHKNRSFPALVCYSESISEGIRQLICLVYKIAVLCNRECNTCYTGFLKRISAYQAVCNVCGNNDHGNAVHICCCYSRNQIGCPRSACSKDDTGFPR